MNVLSKLKVAASIIDFEVKRMLLKFVKVDTVAAAGSDNTDAAALSYQHNVVTVADGTKGVILPKSEVDSKVTIVNTVSNQTLKVYPDAGGQINALTATTGAFSLVGGARGEFMCDAIGHWYVAAANLTGTSTSATTLQLDQAAIPASGAEVVAATNVIAATESGNTFFLDHATEFASTLPAPALGLKFTFIVVNPPETASYTIGTNAAAQVIVGHVLPADGNAGDTETTPGANVITFVDGAAVAGDRVDVVSDGTNWYASCRCAVATGVTLTG